MRQRMKNIEEIGMKVIAGWCTIVLLLIVAPISFSSGAELDGHLKFLSPLIGKEWIGGYVGSESSDIRIVLLFEQVLGGRAVRYIREVEAADFSGVTHFYWNPGRKEVCFISLNNRGIVGEGIVSAENGKIILRGESHRPEKTIEFITTLEIDPEGILRDTFLRKQDGEWVQGHLQEFEVRE
jgi:hypothetical protein